MKCKTSDWLATLSQRALKDLVNILFSVDPIARDYRGYDLFKALRRHVDDEYHGLKGRVPLF
jgi:hypothetical protein